MCNTPVALLMFRRPDLTAQVFDVIRQVKPKELYVIADGPRKDNEADALACEQTRAVIETVDWDCEVHRNYAETNMGCGERVASGLGWLFEHVESAIILEDDCVPDLSFFPYCEELLERYGADDRIMHISGCTYRDKPWETDDSYFFTKYPACWGWATWRRAWQTYDISCKDWSERRDSNFLFDILGDPDVTQHWAELFDEAYAEELRKTTWDYQWAFNCWNQNGLSIFPKENMVSNLGAGDQATHTFEGGLDSMFLPVHEMAFPMKHPQAIEADSALDRQYIREILLPAVPKTPEPRTLMRRVVGKLLPEGVKRSLR